MMERLLEKSSSHAYRPIAFFDDNPKVHGKFLNGIRIYNPADDFKSIVQKLEIRVAIIAVNQLSDERRVHFINQCLDC